MWLGSNGVRLRCPRCWISAATETTTRTSISKPKKKPASRVDTPTPRISIATAPAVIRTLKMPHGTFQWKYFSTVIDRKPPDTARTEDTAIM